MHPELQRRAQRLLVDLLDVPESSREALLAARCGDDQELRGEVLSLLRAAAAAEGFLDTPAIAAARETFATTDAALVGREFGGFRLIEELGRGGMGIVYRATQRSPERDVAVKVTPCAVSLSARRRFEAESRALARMRHPSIAAVHEAGVDATTGIAWIAMEFVDGGRPITVHAREHRLSLLERLRLFREACDAVHHGHLRGVIHRDLKPSNILVGRDGRVKIIDFGIARLLGPDDTGATMTADGTPLGTLSSMSPEQCGGDSVDLRTDVYSLGVVLHELVAGSPPFAVQDRSLEAALRMIRTESPPPLRRLVRDTPRDLETIVLTALEKDPRRRYQSIAALADDLVRLEQHRPIEARPARWTHHVALFARRHVAVVAASACVLLVLLAATFVSLRFAVDAQRERDAAIRHSYVSTIASAGAALDAQELYRLRQQLDRAPSELRGWEWQYLDRQCRSASVVQRAHGQRVTSAAWHPRSDVIATGDLGGTLHLWSADGTSLGAPIEVGQPINGLAWRTAPDSAPAGSPRIGDSLLAIGANRDPLRILRCNQDGLPLGELPERYPLIARGVAAVDLSSDGVSLVYAGERGATLFRLADAHVVATVDAIGAMRGAAFSPDGDRFALTHEHAVEIRRTADGSLVRVLERGASFLDRIAWHPNGEEIAVVDNDGTLAILGVDDGELRGANRAHTRAARAVAYSPDGSRLLTGGDDHQVILWERATLAATRLLAGHHDAVTAVSFAPDGMRAVSASLDGTARVWDLAASDGMSLAFGARWRPTMRTLAFSPDGTRLLAANEHGHAKLLDAESWATLSERETPGIGWWQAAFSPDGSLLAVGHGPEEILLFGRDVHEPIAVLRHGEEGGATGTTTRRAGALAFSPDGTMLASGGGDYGIRVWDLRTEPPVLLVAMPGGAGGHGAEVTGVAFSPDGGRLYSCSVDRSVACWEVDVGPRGSAATARRRWTRVAHEDLVLSLAVHPSDGSVVSGGRDLRIVRFRGDDGVVMDTLASHGQSVSSLVFSADGSRLFTASTAGDVKVWEWPACIELLTLRAPTLGPIRALAMRPDGTELVAAGSGAITRWSTTRAAHLPVRSSATAVTPERGR